MSVCFMCLQSHFLLYLLFPFLPLVSCTFSGWSQIDCTLFRSLFFYSSFFLAFVQSSPAGISSSRIFTNFTRISVVSSPLRLHFEKEHSTCIWTCTNQCEARSTRTRTRTRKKKKEKETISRAPLMTPQRIFE